MTANSIAYGNYLENQRHNLENERISMFNAQETAKHNRETEALGWYNGQEQARHNQAGELISWFNAHENQRNNMALEQIRRDELSELNRTNTVKESISAAHNWNMEAIESRANDIAEVYHKDQIVQQKYATDIGATVSLLTNERTNDTNWNIAKLRSVTDMLNTGAKFFSEWHKTTVENYPNYYDVGY